MLVGVNAKRAVENYTGILYLGKTAKISKMAEAVDSSASAESAAAASLGATQLNIPRPHSSLTKEQFLTTNHQFRCVLRSFKPMVYTGKATTKVGP